MRSGTGTGVDDEMQKRIKSAAAGAGGTGTGDTRRADHLSVLGLRALLDWAIISHGPLSEMWISSCHPAETLKMGQ